MAWNGSQGTVAAEPKKVRRSYAALRLVLPLVLMAIGVGAYLVLIEPKMEVLEVESAPTALIDEAQAEVVTPVETPVVEETLEQPLKPKHREPPKGVLPDENGVLRWPSGARFIEDYSFRENAINPYKGQKQLFKHGSEIHIATLLEATPGNMIISGFEYGSEFDKNFLASLKEEIEFSEDDTEEERRLKEDVITVKKELEAAIAEGKRPSEIMQEAREELIKAFQYKHNLEQQLMAIRHDPTMTAQDIIDSYDAANAMLEKEGLPGFSTGVMKRRLEALKQKELSERGY